MQLVLQSGDLGPKWFHLAIRMLVLLAESEKGLKSTQISELLGDEPTSIRKILNKLAKAELVYAQAGRYGGYYINKEPGSISMKDIYLAFDIPEPVPYWSVPSTGSELYISQIIAKAEHEFQSVLGNYTIADLLKLKQATL